jgi:hypothetical protein
VQSIPKEFVNLTYLDCGGCIALYIPRAVAKKVCVKSRGRKIRDWIYKAKYRAARNAEKRVALAILQTIVSENSTVFDKNVAAVFNRIRV